MLAILYSPSSSQVPDSHDQLAIPLQRYIVTIYFTFLENYIFALGIDEEVAVFLTDRTIAVAYFVFIQWVS